MNWIAKRFLLQLFDLAVFLAAIALIIAIIWSARSFAHVWEGGSILFLPPIESYETLMNRA